MLNYRTVFNICLVIFLIGQFKNQIIDVNSESIIINNPINKKASLEKTLDSFYQKSQDSLISDNNIFNSSPYKNFTNSNLNFYLSNIKEKRITWKNDKRKLKEGKEEPYLFIDKYQQKNISEFQCLNESSCNYRGNCYNQTLCLCEPYYTTYFNNNSMKFNFTQCNYKQISLKTVFTLSFFLGPLSFEHILIGNIITGIVKIVLPMILILIGNSIFIMGRKKVNIILQTSGKVFELAGTVIIIIWWFIDWILILSGYYQDNKNVDLFDDFYN